MLTWGGYWLNHESAPHCQVFFQALAELLAENYHNIWAKKKKVDLEAKGKYNNVHTHTHTHTLFVFIFTKFINY